MAINNAIKFVRVSAYTHKGNVREANEDFVVVGAWRRNLSMDRSRESKHSAAKKLTAAVIDGMGGHAGGKVASALSSKLIVQNRNNYGSEHDAEHSLKSINRQLYDHADKNPHLLGMGATAAGVFCTSESVIWFNVGDSRVYECFNDELRQLSIDDSLVSGGAENHIITQSLGGDVSFCDIAPHTGQVPAKKGAQFVICSDGLSDMISDLAIRETILAGYADPALRLSQYAMKNGGFDNVSVIVLQLE